MDGIDLNTIITYSDIFEEKICAESLCDNLPLIASMRYIACEMSSVVICVNDMESQNQALDKLASTLDFPHEQKLSAIRAKNNVLLLISESSFICYRYLVRFCSDIDTKAELTQTQKEDLYKLILLCNEDIAFKQTRNIDLTIKPKDIVDIRNIFIRQDLPLVEFRTIKSFETQIYKASLFFEFIEQNKEWSTYLEAFYKEKHVSHWTEYINMVFSLINDVITNKENQYEINTTDTHALSYLDDLCIDFQEVKSSGELSDEDNWLNYFRNKFLLKLEDGYILLNLNLLIDKIFQGLFFDYKNVMVKNGFSSTKTIHDKKGQLFSEPYLLYPLLYAISSAGYDKVLSENRLISLGLEKKALPDFYLRKGECAILFEFKDVTLGNASKYSSDTDEIIENINRRLCTQKVNSKGETSQREGVAQLIHSLDKIYNHGLLAGIDPNYNIVNTVFPVIITTDRSFSAAGINMLITEGFTAIQKTVRLKIPKLVIKPIIVELDTLLSCLSSIKRQKLELCSLLWEYVTQSNPINSFASFVHDRYIKNDSNKILNDTLLTREFCSRAGAYEVYKEFSSSNPAICDFEELKFLFVCIKKSNKQYSQVINLLSSWHNVITFSDECYLILGDKTNVYHLWYVNRGDVNIQCLVLNYEIILKELNDVLAKTLNQKVYFSYSFNELKWYYEQDVLSRLSLFNHFLEKFGGSAITLSKQLTGNQSI